MNVRELIDALCKLDFDSPVYYASPVEDDPYYPAQYVGDIICTDDFDNEGIPLPSNAVYITS